MYVPVDVILWPDPSLHLVEQILAPRPDPRAAVIAVPQRGRVRDEDVGAVGDLAPLGRARVAAG